MMWPTGGRVIEVQCPFNKMNFGTMRKWSCYLRSWCVYTGGEAKQSDTKQPKFDVIDNLRKVSTGRQLREQFLNFTRTKLFLNTLKCFHNSMIVNLKLQVFVFRLVT